MELTAEGAGKAFVTYIPAYTKRGRPVGQRATQLPFRRQSLQAAMMDSAAVGTEGGGTDAVTTTTAACACCGMDEECTPRYVARMAVQFGAAWDRGCACGLCTEAIKDEALRRGVGLEAARRALAEYVVSAAGAGSGGPAVQVVRPLLQLLKKVIVGSGRARPADLPPAATTPAPHDVHVVGNNHDLISFESCI